MSYQEEMLKEIADAIREVEGTEEKIPANQFASRVAGLSVAKPSGIITIKENGSHNVANYEWAEVSVEADLNERVIIGKWIMPETNEVVIFRENGTATLGDYEGNYTISKNIITVITSVQLPDGQQFELPVPFMYNSETDTLIMNDGTVEGIFTRVQETANLTTKEITENGTYKASDDGADGYSEVVVNVAGSGATPFAEATPEEIQQVANEISAKGMTSAEVKSKYGWKIGDTKDITLTTGEVIQIRIIGFNHDTLSDGSGTAGITLDMATCLNSYYPMDSDRTNAGGWEVTDMRNTTLPTIKATLPQEWQNVIKKVDKKSANGGSTNFSAVVTTSDDLFLLSEIEVFGKFIQAQNSTDEGFLYEYYSINNTQDSRKKPIGSYNQWWLRSSNIDSTTSFLIVDYNGGEGSSTATSTDRVSFAFCVGSAKDIPIAGLPIEATTDQEMTNALVEDNLGKVYKFTGTSDTYETDAIYIVSEV